MITPADAERRAWQILIGSFTTFLLICGGAIYATQWFVFQSTIPLTATLSVARGTARVTAPNAQEPLAITDGKTDIESGTLVQTDATSQAMVTFSDPVTLEPIASLVIYRDSKVAINAMHAPRFSLNASPYQIQVVAEPGRGHVLLLPSFNRPFLFQLDTAHSTTITTKQGSLAFDVTEQRTELGVLEGETSIGSRASNQLLIFKKGNHVSLDRQSSAVTALANDISLITNSDFSRPYSVGWTAYDISNPVGSVYSSKIDGQNLVVIDRSQDKWPDLTLNHGETGFKQTLDVDVRDMTALELRLTLYIDEQNLSTCGVVGSECPLMLKLSYTNQAGGDQVYIHGFYANHDPSLAYPLLCDSCRTEHERINLHNWYTYSENLLALLPPDQRPIVIKEFALYASGHAYKVYVSEANLIGTRVSATP